MAVKMKVTYLDGREVVMLVPPRAQVMAERHFAGITQEKAVEQAYYLAWASLNKAGKEPADFETFLDLIEDAEQVKEIDYEDPTTAAPPSDESSN